MSSLIHVANVLILLSFLFKDVLGLRLLSISASCCFILYFYFRPQPMLAPIGWNLLFMAVNGYQIGLLLAERRPVFLNAQEELVHRLVFHHLSPRDFLRLIRIARWHAAEEREIIVKHGETVKDMILIASGCMCVEAHGKSLASLEQGQFVGEMSFLTESPASADVFVEAGATYVCWPRKELKALLKQHPSLHAAVHSLIGHDLVRKLRA